MRVRVTEAFRAYIHMPEQFEAGQEVTGDCAVHLLSTGAPVEPLDDEARALAPDARLDEPRAPAPPARKRGGRAPAA